MANIGLLIQPEKVVEETNLYGDIDTAKLQPAIFTAQEIYIQPIIGTDLYNALTAAVIADNLAGDYSTLKTKIEPCLAYYTVMDFIQVGSVAFRNGGIFKRSSDNATPLSQSEIAQFSEWYRGKAEHYKQRVIDWLTYNGSGITEYTSNTNDDIDPSSNNFTGGIFTG